MACSRVNFTFTFTNSLNNVTCCRLGVRILFVAGDWGFSDAARLVPYPERHVKSFHRQENSRSVILARYFLTAEICNAYTAICTLKSAHSFITWRPGRGTLPHMSQFIAVLTTHEDPAMATHKLQRHLNKIQLWLEKMAYGK